MRAVLITLSLLLMLTGPLARAAQLSQGDYNKLQKADQLVEKQQYASAKSLLRGYIKSWQKSRRQAYPRALAQLALGRIALSEDHYKTAYQLFLTAYQDDVLPKAQQTSLLLTLAQLDLNLEHWQQGVDKLKQWLKATPASEHQGRHYQLLALGQYQLKKHAEGLHSIREAFALKTDAPTSWYSLGVALAIAEKQWPQAVTWQGKVVQAKPDEMTQWQQLAALQMRAKQEKAALATMRLAWQRGLFTQADHYKLLSQLAGNQKVPYLAAKVIDDGIAHKEVKATPANLRWSAGLWLQAKQFDQALARYQQLCQREPNKRNYHQYLSLLANQQQWQTLLKAAEQAEKHVSTARIDLLKGIAATQLKKYHQAESYFASARKSKQYAASSKSWLEYIEQVR